MNNNKIVILCPEIVPMDNKGEEAIIRGVMDLLNLNETNCEYHIIDPSVKTMVVKRGLYLHPPKLFFPEWRTKEFGLGLSFDRIYSSFCSALRHVLDRIYPKWISFQPRVVSNYINYIEAFKKGNINQIPKKFRSSIEKLSNVDYIIAGHNGGLDINVCHMLLGISGKLKLPYTIFGSCMYPDISEKNKLELYHKVFLHSENVITRNPLGYRWALKYFGDVNTVLAPDPAFGLVPSKEKELLDLISKLGLTDFFKKDVLLFTTAEPAPISRYAFDHITGRVSKIIAHRKYLGDLLNELLDKFNFNILFLPHTIGPTKDMDDRMIAKDIISIAKQKNDIKGRCYVLDDDLSAAELKGIISKGIMLLAERVHSVIGAIGVNTPVMCLASKHDKRVEGMLKEMAGLTENIYYLNNPNIKDCIQTFSRIYSNLKEEKEKLKGTDILFKRQLHSVSELIISQINSKSKK